MAACSARIDGVRRRVPSAALGRGLPAPEAALLRGMVLGEDAALPADDRATTSGRPGSAHLVAASGQNVALLAALALALARSLGVGLRSRGSLGAARR